MDRELFIVIGSLEIGGAERHLTYVMPLLAQKGWNITIVCLSYKDMLRPVLEKSGLKVRVLSPSSTGRPKSLAFFAKLGVVCLRLFQLYKTHPKALFHYFLPEAYLIGTVMALVAGHKGPRVMSRRSLNIYQQRRPLLGWLERKIHGFTSFFLGNSRAVMKDLVAEGIKPHQAALIYNGVHPSILIPRKSQVFTMMIVANLIPYKGHKDLILALALIKDRLPLPWRLWIVGRDSSGIQQNLQNLCVEYGLQKHIEFLGPREDVEALWAQVHVGILCSYEEGFSNAILEAMALGVPMVVTAVGGNLEAVMDRVTGFVVPANSPQDLGRGILALALDSDLQQTMGTAALQSFQDSFTLERCADAYDKIYKQLINKEPR